MKAKAKLIFSQAARFHSAQWLSKFWQSAAAIVGSIWPRLEAAKKWPVRSRSEWKAEQLCIAATFRKDDHAINGVNARDSPIRT